MSELVSTFLPVEINELRYLFFIVMWSDYTTAVGEELDRQFEAFGEDLGPAGKVVRAYKSARRKSFHEVMGKPWPPEIRERFEREQDPFLLVTDKGFDAFDPERDRWGVVWFSNFVDKPGTVYRLFGALGRKVRQEEDVFAYLGALARREKLGRLGRYFSLKKPEVFGVSIDVEAILQDAFGA